jgi:hypothetical protein
VQRILLIVAVWTLLAIPALCLGGILTHTCLCDADVTCGHEDSCASDPCFQSTRATANKSLSTSIFTSHLVSVAVAFAPAGCRDASGAEVLAFSPASAFDALPASPFHPPLLI